MSEYQIPSGEMATICADGSVVIDPLATIDLKGLVQRSGLPRRTILRWLAEDAINKTPGKRFPRPLDGHKIRWNLLGFTMWMVNHHAGAYADTARPKRAVVRRHAEPV